MSVLLIGVGGFFGAISRYGLSKCLSGVGGAFPLSTLLINFAGAFLIGVVYQIALQTGNLEHHIVKSAMIGLLGGFTTFSTFSLETLGLLETGRIAPAMLNIALSVGLCLIAVLLGKRLVQAF